jgi:hypothetical protein
VSKLLEKLEQTSKGAAKPMGFRAAAAKQETPRMVLIASPDDADRAAAEAAREYADAVLLTKAEGAEKLVSALNDLPWGVFLAEAAEGQLARLKKDGGDFYVFDAATAPLSFLKDEGMGRIAEIAPSLTDGLIRAASQLPVDAVLIGGDGSMSVQRLMTCQHIANLSAVPPMVRVPLAMSADDIRELWETGVSGVVVQVTGRDKEGLKALKQAIDALPARRRKRSIRTEVTLPYVGGDVPPEGEYEEE